MGFYSHHIFICENQRDAGHPRGCCAEKGSVALRDYAKQKAKEMGLNAPRGVRVNSAGCLDRCELGPVMVIYPDETWYHITSTANIDRILTEHVQNGSPVSDLQLSDNQKRLAT